MVLEIMILKNENKYSIIKIIIPVYDMYKYSRIFINYVTDTQNSLKNMRVYLS